MATDGDEGEANARRFETVIGRVLRVSKEELLKREAAYQKRRRRTRKPKVRRASH